MNTVVPTPTEPSLNLFTFEDGICTNPEKVAIAVPKGAKCEILLAYSHDTANWHAGYELAAGEEDRLSVPCGATGGPVESTRERALEFALQDAQRFFAASPKSKLHRRAVTEIEAAIFAIRGESSPANKPGDKLSVELPTPQNLDLDVDGIEPNPHNPRGEISPEDVEELAASLASVGVLQPIGVRLIPADGLPGVGGMRKQLLWGHRRLAAAKVAKLAKIPARVFEGISDDQARLLLLVENGQRKDLDPIQEARGYAEMMRDFELTQDDVAKHVKKSRPVVANALRLLELPESVQGMLASGQLTTAHGTALASYKDFPAMCARLAELVLKNGNSAGEIEDHLLYEDCLCDEELIFTVPESYVVPKALTRYFVPAYTRIGVYCLDREIAAQAKREVAEAKKAAKAKEKEKAAKTKAKEGKQKKEYFGGQDGVAVSAEQEPLLALVPDEKQVIGRESRWQDHKCTIVTDAELWKSILAAGEAVLLADWKQNLTPLLEKAWQRVQGWKKFDGVAAVALMYARADFSPADLSGPVVQRLGLGLAKHAKLAFVKDRWGDPVPKLGEFAKMDPVQLAQLTMGCTLARIEQALAENKRRENDLVWLCTVNGLDRREITFLGDNEKKLVAAIKEEMRPRVGDRVQWQYAGAAVVGTVKSWEEFDQANEIPAPDDRKANIPVYADKASFGGHWHVLIVSESVRVIERAKPEDKSPAAAPAKKAKKGGKKK